VRGRNRERERERARERARVGKRTTEKERDKALNLSVVTQSINHLNRLTAINLKH
jgi:hypothetical protein